MVSIQQNIYYLVDFKTQEIFVYDNFVKAREKQEFFREKYGAISVTLSNGNIIEDCDPISYSQKKLKHYYGTVFILYKFKENNVLVSYIEGRKKEIDQICKYNKLTDYTLKKIVITPYDEFKKRFEPEEEEEEDTFFDTTTPKRGFF